MKSKEYKLLKNFIHNELGLTKETFTGLLKEAIKDEAKAFVQRQFHTDEKQMIASMKEEIKKDVIKKCSGGGYNTDARSLYEAIGKEIAKGMKIQSDVIKE